MTGKQEDGRRDVGTVIRKVGETEHSYDSEELIRVIALVSPTLGTIPEAMKAIANPGSLRSSESDSDLAGRIEAAIKGIDGNVDNDLRGKDLKWLERELLKRSKTKDKSDALRELSRIASGVRDPWRRAGIYLEASRAFEALGDKTTSSEIAAQAYNDAKSIEYRRGIEAFGPDTLLEVAERLAALNDSSQSYEAAGLAERDFAKIPDGIDKIRTLISAARIMSFLYKIQDAEAVLTRADAIARRLRTDEDQIQFTNEVFEGSLKAKLYSYATILARKQLTYDSQSDGLMRLAEHMIGEHSLSEGRELLDEARSLAEKIPDMKTRDRQLVSIAKNYAHLHSFDKAIELCADVPAIGKLNVYAAVLNESHSSRQIARTSNAN
jgi:hypothetical protein